MKNKILIRFLSVVLVSAVALPFLPVRGEGAVYEKVIRLHVLANSDSEEDQALKLLVRDGVLEYVGELTKGVLNVDQAREVISSSLDGIGNAAERVILENGRNDKVTVRFGMEDYPEREYDGVHLPAGEYCSLRVCIGEAEGHNWWCVLFPPLCLSASKPKEVLVKAGFSPDQVRVLTETENPKYVMRFRILELVKELFG